MKIIGNANVNAGFVRDQREEKRCRRSAKSIKPTTFKFLYHNPFDLLIVIIDALLHRIENWFYTVIDVAEHLDAWEYVNGYSQRIA